ncbi:phosphatidylserine/phosphatidylglycerophosphate/cardiolipin synthase family protein [Ktedonosporobacter rubrisoli]|uniref:Phosphatidylserine/phosphatidylglycerophosphate/ cardiolipin synthase family protein n=1 Tax=Ktedonosporobacter rubrisoli TaxID=2509675 RepID=A0A4V0YYW2_KTERU|nr:phospholipase D-like domain-containing protein [Ktedonosporobacter rubrisoli]QBD77611.1 phosphatidylserine/phosphatidylglycerophosphate/cardiolipin synthase family protein [Ktedonosporobacter rubrisoli]
MLWRTGCLIFLLQCLVAMLLLIIASLGRRHKHDTRFPYRSLEEIQVGANRLQLYAYGEDLYKAMFEAIDNASDYIYLESYIWKGDELGKEFQRRLAQKAAEGVKVYVIFDRFGNLVVPRTFKSGFDPAIHVLEYRAIRRPWQIFDLRHYALDHRKLLVVDDTISFIGGYNIGELYAKEWRDTHLRLRGAIATEFSQSFIDFWNRFCPEKEQIREYHRRHFNPRIRLSQNEAMRLTFPIRDMYIVAIDKAAESILLTTAYFIPDHILLDALKNAARRGVDVRILVPWNSNHILADWISRSYFAGCLQAGIHILGYRHTMLHAKTCTIDEQWSTVGTANLDRLSLLGNYEINVEIYSKDFAQQMQALFACDSSEVFELNAEDWQRRAWYIKLSEHLLSPWRFMM